MNTTNYQLCSRCVMDTSDPDITFDENGYCNHCTEYLEKTSVRMYQGKTSDIEFEKLIKKIKESGKNKKYDCIVAISGGVDSCYTAYITKKAGLRVLTVHLDNGWDTEVSVSNIKRAIDQFGFDYQSYVLNWEEFKYMQIAFLKSSIIDAEIPTDIAIPGSLHKIADQNNIKYILIGSNFATEGILPKSWAYYAKDMKLFNAICKRFDVKKMTSYPSFGYKKEIYYKLIKGIKLTYLLNYVPYSKKDAMKLLEKEIGWKNYGGKHHESIYTGFLQSYILPEKFNIDYRRATFSTQICAGEITRNEALEELKKKPYDPNTIEQQKEYVCNKLGITLREFENIMALPPKTYKDFPNDNKKLEFLYSFYRRLKN